jgi:2-hydroxychromene-2-carboxylate isomerase
MCNLTVYTDYKSPYAYLTKDLAYELERDLPVRLERLPYILDIPRASSARRASMPMAAFWRRTATRISGVACATAYMDCRRQAHKRGLAIRRPQKIWDSTLAAAGMLYAQRVGDAVFRRYHDTVFKRFWRRELDIEDVAVFAAVLAEAGADGPAFVAQAQAGRDEVAAISHAAEAIGVFGMPSLIVDGGMVWGSEHLPDIRTMLAT